MKTFKPNLITSALFAGGMALSNAALAQEQGNAQATPDKDVEVIAVSGVRVSILSALDAKKNSDVVGDFVGGGDLGVLPDPSIADALGRVAGVTTVRENGQSSQLNIRGMNGDFIQTTLNGREQASTSGYTESTRWMAFDQYPAELITEAAVYKSPKASHIEGGVAGLVELKTVNPLKGEKEHNFNASVRASYNDAASDVGADEFGERLTLSYTGKFLEDTLGLALGYSHLSQPNSFIKARAGADSQIGYGDGRARAFQWQAGTGNDERNGYLASLVYQPNENFTAQFDYFRSDFDREDIRHGITVGGLQNANTFDLSNTTTVDGAVTGATVSLTDPNTTFDSSPWFESRSEDQSTQAETDSFGLNLEWHIDETQKLTVDIARSEGTKTRKDRIVSMHAYDLTYTGDTLTTWQEAAGQSFTYVGNGSGIPTASFGGVDFTDVEQMQMSRYEEYPHLYTDEVTSFKVDYRKYVELGMITSFEAGARVSKREFNADRGTFLYGARDGQFNGYCADNLSDIDCMPQSLAGFVTVESTPGVPDHLVVTDFDGLATSIFGAGNYEGKKVFSRDWTFVESGLLEEKVDAYYLMANLETELGDVLVTGNVGVRYVKTDVKSSGVQNVGAGNGTSITDGVGVTQDNYDYVSYGPEYSDTLPSLNLNFQLTDNDVLRLAAAKVMGRPPVGQLKGGAGSWNSMNNDGQTEYNVWTKGSPYLDPFRATQFDLSYEHYFEEEGAVTVALFWKDIESLVEKQFFGPDQTGQAFFDNLGIDIPEGQVAGAFETFVNNDKGGYIRGIELAGTKTFTNLPGVFAGLGLSASYSYTESETEISGGNLFGTNQPLPGLSENVWSTTVFWDIGNFSTHVNVRYRDEFVLNLPIPGSSTPVLSQEYTTVDAQASYAFENGFDIVFSVHNLTDEANVVEYNQPGQLGEYTEFGRQFYLGLNYKY
ncbi:TonB-dependent receptor [Aliiglaciecola sp. CAU 1673]|uniref:TonB-dependent receptor n=1 Tax=Aliiglaciecola sp. CAU 1673 TaxID=3032595 RepID=UPI0023D9EA93|nr:TonB-dependent receptor [Aliiglaciecola sp. CAU 1673]MDF2179026.1 TonB-dependent receptor [Aliiglaciecola sp. CAU 1673]